MPVHGYMTFLTCRLLESMPSICCSVRMLHPRGPRALSPAHCSVRRHCSPLPATRAAWAVFWRQGWLLPQLLPVHPSSTSCEQKSEPHSVLCGTSLPLSWAPESVQLPPDSTFVQRELTGAQDIWSQYSKTLKSCMSFQTFKDFRSFQLLLYVFSSCFMQELFLKFHSGDPGKRTFHVIPTRKKTAIRIKSACVLNYCYINYFFFNYFRWISGSADWKHNSNFSKWYACAMLKTKTSSGEQRSPICTTASLLLFLHLRPVVAASSNLRCLNGLGTSNNIQCIKWFPWILWVTVHHSARISTALRVLFNNQHR